MDNLIIKIALGVALGIGAVAGSVAIFEYLRCIFMGVC